MVVDLMNKRGKIITIEGLDGSGKATQTKLLEQKLQVWVSTQNM